MTHPRPDAPEVRPTPYVPPRPEAHQGPRPAEAYRVPIKQPEQDPDGGYLDDDLDDVCPVCGLDDEDHDPDECVDPLDVEGHQL